MFPAGGGPGEAETTDALSERDDTLRFLHGLDRGPRSGRTAALGRRPVPPLAGTFSLGYRIVDVLSPGFAIVRPRLRTLELGSRSSGSARPI
jgi:hypothetical protein